MLFDLHVVGDTSVVLFMVTVVTSRIPKILTHVYIFRSDIQDRRNKLRFFHIFQHILDDLITSSKRIIIIINDNRVYEKTAL